MKTMVKYTQLQRVQADLRAGRITCRELVEHYLQRIEATRELNAYVEVYAAEARARADALDAQWAERPDSLGRLWGMVISHKDVICYAGHGVTAAAKILEGFESLYSATAVERLLAEDVIIIGRVNCDQFGMGSSNENSVYGPVRNAADPERVPGGSSGGSAVAVQADTCLVSLGTDTGGSVRQPAAFCGLVGMKPTYGRISRYGLLAYASSFDQIGMLAHSIEDVALLLEIMAGPDEMDATTSQRSVPAYSEQLAHRGPARIAYLEPAIAHPSLDPQIAARTRSLIAALREDGHQLDAVDFPYLDHIIPAYYVLTTAEASSNLARFDGIRYGYRHPEAQDLLETYQKSRTEGFSDEVKRRILLGTFVLSSGYYDAYYTKAQQVRRLIQERTAAILAEYDFILMPVSPSTAWKMGEKSDDPVAMYLADIYTVQANMAGIPAVALPLDVHDNGMPFGVQLLAQRFAEAELLAFAAHLKGTYV